MAHNLSITEYFYRLSSYLGGYPLLILVFGIECIVFYKSSKGLFICCRVTELQIIFFNNGEYMLFKRNFNIIISAIMCFVERERNWSATKHGRINEPYIEIKQTLKPE